MPTYVFACEACRHEFSVRTSWRDKEAVLCPACGGAALKELLGRYNVATVSSGGSGLSAANDDCACGAPVPGG